MMRPPLRLLCLGLLLSLPPAALAQRPPGQALAGLEVAEGLEATLFAAEPMLHNPTNIDVDARGRVWVTEGVNYRPQLNPQNPGRPGGDRILILEDTDGDGRLDHRKVYYQGPDVNAALGIAVLGDRVVVSVSPNVFVFTDEDGDDRPDRKEILFTGLSGVQNDHGVHAVVFGPDGKLYFNFGNAGEQVRDRLGNLVVDRAGHAVIASGEPYRQGMAFRVNPDGSEFEVLAHNFRNNYELAVDSYGTLWQSDNDDDGNRSVRINYVMEFGNYGYRDEMTGAGWSASRTNLEPEIPRRHWHQNDPGVVPNLLLTGAGSPTGILVYEGRLLPPRFRGQLIHADAGPNVVRAYAVTDDGAGYRAEIHDLLRGVEDQWFRPSDVCVAPDGSLVVADWYDPGVGGHQVGDLTRGRLFRVAPPNAPYAVPALDLETPEGAARALQSPNLATRYLAWTRLHGWQARAEPALAALWRSGEPRMRARALWLLAKIEGRGAHYVGLALADADPNIRVTGLRAARQIGLDVPALVRTLADDPSPQVRREAAIALRHSQSPEAAQLWASLAARHDGRDRWYLEALGIGAEGNWDRFFEAWLARAGPGWNDPAGRDVVWRSRARAAIPMLAELIRGASPSERLRYFRAFDFHRDSSRQEVLLSLLDGGGADAPGIEALALRHLDPAAAAGRPEVRRALDRTLQAARDTPGYVELVARYDRRDHNPELLALALAQPDSTLGEEAGALLLRQGGAGLLREALASEDERTVSAALTVLGNTGSAAAKDLLQAVALDDARPLAVRGTAVRMLARGWDGEDRLLGLLRDGRLDEALRPDAAGVLLVAYRGSIREEAAQLLGLAAPEGGRPLPPIPELLAREGDPERGRAVFAGLCASCHRAGDLGADFGPALTEIGDKLPKDALYLAILHPDAGISFGYEGYLLELRDGGRAVGVIRSETADALELAMQGGITARYAKRDVQRRTPLEHSLMPAELHQAVTDQELVDLVKFLSTLRRAGG